MSIVGYDDLEIMQELPVPVTTLRVRSDEVGRRAARYLIAAIEGGSTDIARECEVEIVERSLAGPVGAGKASRSAPELRRACDGCERQKGDATNDTA